jgi:hypothetical protein
MFGLDPITNIEQYLPSCSSTRTVLQISIHFGASWVDTILGVMTLFQDFLPQGGIRWYTDSILVPIHSLHIFPKLGALALLHEFSNLPYF